MRTTQPAVGERLRRAVRGDLRADESPPAAEDAVHAQVGAPSRGRRPAGRAWCRAAAGRGRRGARRCARPRVGRRAAWCLRPRRRRGPRRPARVSARARSSPSSWCVGLRRGSASRPLRPRGRSGGVGSGPQLTGLTSPSGHRRSARPRSASGTSSATAAVTSTCSASATSSASCAAPLGVELGEHVVEDQHRVVAVGAQQVVGRQPQRQRERPGLAVAGVALDRQRRPEAESSRSSRCGPTSETPRSSSSARRRSISASSASLERRAVRPAPGAVRAARTTAGRSSSASSRVAPRATAS